MREPDLITVDQAIAILDAAPVTPRVKRVRLEEAQGLPLAQDISADRDYPPFDKAVMDGFAVRYEDAKAAPVELEVVGEVAAGQRHPRALQAGQAIAIMTGAPVPEGADTVVPIEDCTPQGKRVRINASRGLAKNISPCGSDCASGVIVLNRGTKLEAVQLAVAGSVGAAEVEVFDRPSVAVLSTGDELVEIHQAPGPAQIRNSNNIMLVGLLRRLGCAVADLGIVRDDPELIRQAIERGFKSDALFISGGMSMGQYDYVPRILTELGVALKITKLRIKPGKPFVFGTNGARGKGQGASEDALAPRPSPLAPHTFVFGLPGNPVSSFVCTLRLCSRILGRLGGIENLERWQSVPVTITLGPNGPREFYQPAVLSDGRVTPLKWKGSADLYTLAQANVLIVRPESAPAVPAGEAVRVLEIPS